MTDTRKLVEELEVEAKAAHHGDGLASLFWNVADTITALSERCRVMEDERYQLALAICGGEDFPGLLDGTSVEALVVIARKSAAMHMETIDRVLWAEAALRFYADPENWEPQIEQHETSCSLDDSPCDLDRGGRARAALTSGGRG